jgi:hypothetical protein
MIVGYKFEGCDSGLSILRVLLPSYICLGGLRKNPNNFVQNRRHQEVKNTKLERCVHSVSGLVRDPFVLFVTERVLSFEKKKVLATLV